MVGVAGGGGLFTSWQGYEKEKEEDEGAKYHYPLQRHSPNELTSSC
jgi:hypothetical protein